MWEHPESAVIMDLTVKMTAAARRGDMAESRALCDLITDLERIYPAAAREIEARYPQDQPAQ